MENSSVLSLRQTCSKSSVRNGHYKMDPIAQDIIRFLEQYVGALAPLILLREIDAIGHKSIVEMDDDAKRTLVENIIADIVSKVESPPKVTVTRSVLISKMQLSRKWHSRYERTAYLDFSRSD
jgi:hypothetical protein